MPDFDAAQELEGQEKYDALFDIIKYEIQEEVTEWIESLK